MNISLLAIDPGYDRCGLAVLHKSNSTIQIVYKDCIETNKSNSLLERYATIVNKVEEVLEQHPIDELAMETIFFSKNVSTAISVAQVRGLIIALAIQHKVEVFEYNPMQIKQATTGFGNASKQAIDKMVRLQLNIDGKEKIIDDTMDALAVGITHFASSRMIERSKVQKKA